ncbi:MAG: hypothetical protein HY747_05000 [Elusimicrobia bacterium]|nr:hypothetical protein [Elusimicrobiota bacterium]
MIMFMPAWDQVSILLLSGNTKNLLILYFFVTQLNRLIRQFNQQAANAQPGGYILQGSVIKRNLERRTRGVSMAYGPYYIWTRKIHNKTVTQALTAEQAQIIQDALNRNRQLEQQLMRLRKLSEQIIEAMAPCVVKRNRNRPK